MANRLLCKALLGLALAVGSANAQVYVRTAPPPPRKDVIVVRPGPGYVWQAGYYRWDGRVYVWVPGRWLRPPQAYYHSWVPGYWKQTPRGWVWVQGHWVR
ncbi:MAG: YXWGXW repeat-containing protein [Acidobacteriaceae bacterium]|nr:YXWGXW repeat-containing protein [Acidobacteriaceae bacterium]MBV8572626.1 YXWGXW repeat-containing protein [Acidobacteriaceae bacterium]